jgi:hypothetical protein
MTKILKMGLIFMCFGYLDIGYWNLFGAWDLVIGI